MNVWLKYFKRVFIFFLLFSAVSLLFIYWSNSKIESYSSQCFDDINEVPFKKVALVLGTGKFVSNGNLNLYYSYRLEAALKLYESGKINYLLISGDNSRKSYDEPSTFKTDLVKMGIPSSKIFLDYAGFRTLDSIERTKAVFGENDIIVVSQPFHNKRALFIADHKGLEAVAYNAKDVSGRYGFRVQLREKLARCKAILDIYLFGTKPKFYGKPIVIE